VRTDLEIAMNLLRQDALAMNYTVVGLLELEEFMVVVKKLSRDSNSTEFDAWSFTINFEASGPNTIGSCALHWQDRICGDEKLGEVLIRVAGIATITVDGECDGACCDPGLGDKCPKKYETPGKASKPVETAQKAPEAAETQPHDCCEHLLFVAHYAAPGYGQAWKCETCGRGCWRLSSHDEPEWDDDPDRDVHDMPVSWII
jgi:hypothetical protein